MVQIKYKDKVYEYDSKEYYNKDKIECERCKSIIRAKYLKKHQESKKCIDYELYLQETINNNVTNNNEQ
jgi:hypothetical protein